MRTVLVTGVSTGIGKSIAEKLLENKFYIIGTVRNKDDADYLKNKFPESFSRIYVLSQNFSLWPQFAGGLL